ncbi:MAG: amino acid permease [Hyphomonadaceae bacterium]|nr:amino acid permease [Hyphomonadaceae bacterium]
MAQGQLFAKKSVAHVQAEFNQGELKRTLGPLNLVSLGIGGIIGAGIFVMTGNAAANYAGPAVMLSFVIAGIACGFAALCYAELASTMPVSGSAYTYSYVTLGEVFAWAMGWLLLLEYGLAASTVASGWTGYVVSMLADFGLVIPEALSQSTLQYRDGAMVVTGHVNLVGALGIMAVTSLLVLGVHESAQANNIIVAIKVTVLLAFILVGIAYVNTAFWDPFIPPNEGGAHFGAQGVLRAASIVFFAYVGFEAVSTAAGEARNPQRDIPIGILGSLVACTLIYMAVAAVMTGVVPFRELAGGAPIAVAIDRMNPSWAIVPWPFSDSGTLNIFSFLIKIGAFAGLSSVMLVLIYAQTRVFYQMSKDGLVPGIFGRIDARFRTPAAGTLLLGSLIAIAAATLPLGLLGDLVSLGTALAFAMVCITVIYMRQAHPDIARPFRVPFYPITPILGVIACVVFMMGPILLGLASQVTGVDYWSSIFGLAPGQDGRVPVEPLPSILLLCYVVIGVLVYALFGYRNSKISHPAPTQTLAE